MESVNGKNLPAGIFTKDTAQEKLQSKQSLLEKIATVYWQAVKAMVDFFYRHKLELPAISLGTLFSEPLLSFKTALYMFYYPRKESHIFGLNPDSVTEEQKQNGKAVLFLHGNYHDETAWVRLAKRCQEKGIPAFTVKLPSGAITEKDMQIINDKYKAITALFSGEKFSIDIVGHSRGGYLAPRAAAGKKHLGRVIVIGHPDALDETGLCKELGEERLQKTYLINGLKDLITGDGLGAKEQKGRAYFADTGHLGLMHSDVVDNFVMTILK